MMMDGGVGEIGLAYFGIYLPYYKMAITACICAGAQSSSSSHHHHRGRMCGNGKIKILASETQTQTWHNLICNALLGPILFGSYSI